MLEGSIRRADSRVRIAAQLIDATTGANRWAERYDRELEDVFAVQDEVARTIVAILVAHVNKGETERISLKPPAVWQAYDYYLKGTQLYALFFSTFAARDLYECRRLLETAISIDPAYARAYALLSTTHQFAFIQPIDEDYLKPSTIDRAYELARKSIELDPNLPLAYAELGMALSYKGQRERAIAAFQKAIELNPNFSDIRYAAALIFSGQFLKAIDVSRSHMRLDPFYLPLVPLMPGMAHYLLRQYDEAAVYLREYISRAPNARVGHAWLAATYAQLERFEEARVEVAEVRRIDPKATISTLPMKRLNMFKDASDNEHFFDGLRKAGLPE